MNSGKIEGVLGLDIGNVITGGDTDNNVLFTPDKYLEVKQVQGAFDGIQKLVDRFSGNVVLISKCGPDISRKTLEWFVYQNFYDQTGIKPWAVHFCLKREEKAPLCVRFGVTHFVDDRLEVLGYMSSVKHRYLFSGRKKEIDRNHRHLPDVIPVANWQELLQVII